ncbi:hypothetical protein SprV_0702249600 [Sparganum proliferum]
MLVADMAVSFAVVDADDRDVLEILRDFSLTPHLLEERRQMIHDLRATVLADFSRDHVRSGRFPGRELLRGPDGFVERKREVEIGVGFHLRQPGDDGVGDDRGTVQDAPKILGPLLKTFCLLCGYGTAVNAEKRSNCFVWRTVDNFDRGEEVLLFISVRVPLDLLGLASRPSVLHLAQPLLPKATTTVEGCFVVGGGADDVGFVQAVLLGEQVADDGVVLVEPVLLLAVCTTEDGQSRRRNCVPQLSPSILHGGLLVSGAEATERLASR